MTTRNISLISVLAILMGGCIVVPAQQGDRGHYRDTSRDTYRDTNRDAYRDAEPYEQRYDERYDYARIIYIGTIPYYVGDDRRARPLPPHMRDRYRYAPGNSNTAREVQVFFGRDAGVQDGYALSRIVYVNELPHYVEDDRRARPLPRHLHGRFGYSAIMNQGNGRPYGDRPLPQPQVQQPPVQQPQMQQPQVQQPQNGDARRREELLRQALGLGKGGNAAPSGAGVAPPLPQVQQPPEPPAPVASLPGRERPEPPAFGRDRGRFEPPAYGRDRDQQNGLNNNARPRDEMRRETPPFGNNARPMPNARPDNGQARLGDNREFVRPGQPAAGEPRFDVPPANGRGRADEQPPRNNGGNGQGPGLVSPGAQNVMGRAAPPAPNGNAPDGNGRGRGDDHSKKNHDGKDKDQKDQAENSSEEGKGMSNEQGKKERRE